MFLLDENSSLLWIIGVVILIILLIVICFILVRKANKNKFLKQRNEENNLLITYLGGFDNIIKAIANGSRLSLTLNDYKIINEEKLKELGVSTIIKMSNKITLVIGEDAKAIEKLINKD